MDRASIRRCRRAHPRRVLALWCALTLACAGARGQQASAVDAPAMDPIVLGDGGGAVKGRRPDAAQRIVRLFDFERHLNDPARAELFELPRDWDLAQDGDKSPRAGYPRWNSAALDGDVAFEGESSLRLDVRGGSVCLRLHAGAAPVFPATQYLVSAKVRTLGLNRARAVIVARYLDQSGRPIERSEQVSELASGKEWALVSVTLPGTIDESAFVQVDLSIVQPEVFADAGLGPHQVWEEDYAGRAWFDDVAIVQLPSVRMGTGTAGNIVPSEQKPGIEVRVRDLSGEDLWASLIVQDAWGRTVDRSERALEGGRSSWKWEPALSAYGWYHGVLELRAKERRVGSSSVDFVWAAPSARAGPERSRFGVVLDEIPDRADAALERLLEASGSGHVVAPAWGEATRAQDIEGISVRLSGLAGVWAHHGRQTSLCLARVPGALAEESHVDARRPLAIFALPAAMWGPYLSPLLDRLGQTVSRWQVGDPREAAGDSAEDDSAPLMGALRRLVPGPVIATGGSIEEPRETSAPRGRETILPVPIGMGWSGAAEAARAWCQGGRSGSITFLLDPSHEGVTPAQSVSRLVKQMVGLWSEAGGAPVGSESGDHAPWLMMSQAWSWRSTPGLSQEPAAMPEAALAAWRVASERLQGRRVLGSFPASSGITCFVLGADEAGRSGALVAWRDRPGEDGGDGALEAYLGPGAVRVVDCFGNERREEPTRVRSHQGVTQVHRIPLSDEPVFVEDVDTGLARFVAGFGVEPAQVSCDGQERTLTMRLSNPWGMRVSGRIRVVEPAAAPAGEGDGWRIAPREQSFAMDPGQSVSLPVSVSFSDVEEAGPRPFVAEVELSAGKDYPPVRLRGTIEVTLANLHLEVSQRSAGRDVVVEAQVTNHGREAATLSLGVFAPGQPRQHASVSDLQPGATTTRRFVFPNAGGALRGQRVSVGVQQVEHAGRLNKSVVVE